MKEKKEMEECKRSLSAKRKQQSERPSLEPSSQLSSKTPEYSGYIHERLFK